MWPIGRPPQWVGREAELAAFNGLVDALHDGSGAVAWIEGEPGIGKSSLVAEALADRDPRWDIGWGMADQISERLPLRVMLDCLQVRAGAADPRRARAAETLRDRAPSLLAGGDVSTTGLEVLVTLVDELCAAAPTVLVLDDVQWADEASLLVWHQLATSARQLPLLVIGVCRSVPRRPAVQQVRASVARRGGTLITLSRLAQADVDALVTSMVGAPPGQALRRLTAQAGGNPLYVRELMDGLLRDEAVRVETTAELAVPADRLPASLASVLSDRLSSVSSETAALLRAGALLGGRFTATDLAVIVRRPVSELAAGLDEAVTAGILAGSGTDLVFRHALLRQALYEGMPLAVRTALHAEAARELAAADADALSVARQLSAAQWPGDGWVRQWLLANTATLATRAPQVGVELLRRELGGAPGDDRDRGRLLAGLAWALLAAGSYAEAASHAHRALTVLTDPLERAEAAWLLARAQVSTGDDAAASATIASLLASDDLPGQWRARITAMLPMVQRVSTGDLDAARASASKALAVAEQAGDAFAAAHALVALWLVHSVRRDHAAALDCLEQGLQTLGDDPGLQDLRLYLLNLRIFTLQNLDQWHRAERALHRARGFALSTGIPDRSTWATAAVLRYWLGQWDDALAELGADDAAADAYLRERWPPLLIHGVGALVAGRRDQRDAADRELRRGLALPIENLTDRENRDFLVVAHALALEQRGETGPAMARLAGLLPRGPEEMTLVHQWLPGLVRLALAAGDPATARTATEACAAEAAAETLPARAFAASLRCQGLLESDPDPLAEAVAHYRAAGPAAELPAALEDLAAALAGRDHEDDARAALHEAVGLYEGMQARWDIRRADGRLRAYGIRRGPRGRRGRPAVSGWQALTPTEVKIAALVARGDSTSEIAQGMFLTRRTVQTYISRILAKLDAKSRVEIVREALLQGVSA